MAKEDYSRIVIRKGTAADWELADPVLADGEPCLETDTGRLKIGDGNFIWTQTPYVNKARGNWAVDTWYYPGDTFQYGSGNFFVKALSGFKSDAGVVPDSSLGLLNYYERAAGGIRPWEAGPWSEGEIAINGQILARAKVKITNSTSAPTANGAYWDIIYKAAADTLATQSVDGLMSAADKAYLDGLPTEIGGLTTELSGTTATASDALNTANSALETANQKIAMSDLTGSKYLDQSGSKIYASATGTGAYAATINPGITAYATGQHFFITFTSENTGASTLNLNGLGTKAIVKDVNTALAAKDIKAGVTMLVFYNGTNFQLVGATGAVKESYQVDYNTNIDTEGYLYFKGRIKNITVDLPAEITAVTYYTRTTGGAWSSAYANLAALETYASSTVGTSTKWDLKMVITPAATPTGLCAITGTYERVG